MHGNLDQKGLPGGTWYMTANAIGQAIYASKRILHGTDSVQGPTDAYPAVPHERLCCRSCITQSTSIKTQKESCRHIHAHAVHRKKTHTPVMAACSQTPMVNVICAMWVTSKGLLAGQNDMGMHRAGVGNPHVVVT